MQGEALVPQPLFTQDKQRTYNVTFRRVSCNHCRSGKAITITYSACVFVDLGINSAMRMRHIIICRLSDSTIFFPTFS